MRGAPSVIVHAVFFGLKRAYQSTLRLTRRALARLGLTAARFDMLYALRGTPYGNYQAGIGRTLGVTGATVSRMVKALEDLGLVTRERSSVDRRHTWVRITALGRSTLGRAEYSLVTSGHVALAVDSALTEQWWNAAAVLAAVDAIDGRLQRIRDAFHDKGCLVYPWDPDD